MKEFFWKLIGGDPYILYEAGEQSKKWFYYLGITFLILGFATFISFLGLFYGVLDSFISALIGSIILTFILTNLYRLVLISLEPSTLPVAKEHRRKPWAYTVRVTVVILIGLFVTKSLENLLFGQLVDGLVADHVNVNNNSVALDELNKSEYYLLHIKFLNIHYPWINLISLFIVSLYILPVILKHRLKKRNEYYQIRRVIDKRLVEDNFTKFKSIYITIMQNLYAARSELDKKHLKDNFSEKSPKYVYRYHQRFKDEPFNTQPILTKYSYKSTKEFLDNF